jgi:hypothetical protein
MYLLNGLHEALAHILGAQIIGHEDAHGADALKRAQQHWHDLNG